MGKFIILGIIGAVAIVGTVTYVLSKSKEKTAQTNNVLNELSDENLDDTIEEETPAEDIAEVREKVFSNMTERHNLAAGFIKQAVEEMNSDNVPESQNDKSFNDMMNDLDMLSEEK